LIEIFLIGALDLAGTLPAFLAGLRDAGFALEGSLRVIFAMIRVY
jgi:hypothetical protein